MRKKTIAIALSALVTTAVVIQDGLAGKGGAAGGHPGGAGMPGVDMGHGMPKGRGSSGMMPGSRGTGGTGQGLDMPSRGGSAYKGQGVDAKTRERVGEDQGKGKLERRAGDFLD
jgi:hypothetical protein